ncbi:UDP-N-acetylmuramoyl-L-alanyl-D-glutamate--2,6-diaminopimelate ligase [Terribacillus halophilus]|uniref:UDP-N-acetylmuramoyl-L-alanyl-D-glutamate--2,6-diaminopimelate ligase n=1 Tax=Terribacillus halophilus TaxID=361279 RepID=A0A1G6NGE1_9BACI|nr:UDP-N-acetylmuramoyl-L-alanyl-D-glutamate--2,6-diaminopimelate ligase [Terribacillus halophilus]
MKLAVLLSALPFYKQQADHEQIDITGVTIDSREVESGNLFICIDGAVVDGHAFAKQAQDQGAAAILAERPLDVSIPVILVKDTLRALAPLANVFYNHPSKEMRVIGITGTNGKTSMTYLLESIFRANKEATGVIGTIQMKIKEETYPVKNTTPDALFLQKGFRKMVDEGVDTAVIEVSSHALDRGRVHGTDIDVAVFTNLSQDHLDYHASFEDYFHAKSLLFSQLGNTFDPEHPKYAVINADDHYAQALIKSTAQPVCTYGIDKPADIIATDIQLASNGTSFLLQTPKGEAKITSKLMGKFNVYNMLAAVGAAICSDIPFATICQALQETTGVAGRFEPVMAGQSFGVIVDYAHTPDSLENVLTTIKSFVKGKIITVVGCGGDRDKTKRPLMAGKAVQYSDTAIFTADNPRTEDPGAILEDMIRGLDSDKYVVVPDRAEAIQHAIDLAQAEDIVLIAGKGHETYQIIGTQVLDFDDRLVAAEAIKRAGLGE